MLTLFSGTDRGRFQNSWLDSRHSFSFGEYFDPARMGVSTLRVINDDCIAPGGGFSAHSHRDMEIVSYVLSGSLEHWDSLGNGGIIRVGDVQRMSAGTGVTHSEFNPSKTETNRFLQIWLLPTEKNSQPGYEQKFFGREEKTNRLALVLSPDGRDGSVTIHSDVSLYVGLLDAGTTLEHHPDPDRLTYHHVAQGAVILNGQRLLTGDGITVPAGTVSRLTAEADSEILTFDLPSQ